MKKILIVSDAVSIGGAEMYIKNLMKLLEADCQFEVTGNAVLKDVFPELIIGCYSNRRPIRSIIYFLKVFSKTKPDIVHLNLTHLSACFWIQFLFLFLLRPRCVATLHLVEEEVRFQWKTPLLRLFYKRMTVILVSFHALDMLKKAHFHEGQLAVVPNWIDTSVFTIPSQEERTAARDRLSIHEDQKVRLFIGRFEKQKNIDVLFELCEEWVQSNEGVVYFVGEGSYKDRMAEKIRKSRVADRIRIEGFTQNPKYYYWAADVFLLLSKNECTPLTLLEAMACGVSPIVTDCGDMARMVGDQRFVWDESGVASFGKTLQRAFGQSPEKWRKQVEENYSSPVSKQLMFHVYQYLTD